MPSTPTSYDTVRYPSYTHPQTHPDRLAVLGRLFGLEPACVDHCRVLELGCGNGANLIPMAWSLPRSEFLGLDLAADPVADGNEMLRGLSLTNARLIHGSVTEINRDWGSFDYIIAHGLFSWVPANVREKILAVCHDCLAPQGIAFVSYNALPGCHLRIMLREMMLFHIRGFESPEERIKQSQAFVQFLAEAQDTQDDYRLWLRAEAKRILEHSPGHLYHDELSEINEPLYFTQFMQQAARHGLQYLGEADYFEMSDHIFKDTVRQTLGQLATNRILREQYLDFLKCRRFRQTLLCREGTRLTSEPQAENVEHFFIASAVEGTSSPDGQPPSKHQVFTSPKGATVETDFALGQSALVVLGEIWPQPLSFDELLQKASARLGKTGEGTTDPQATRVRLCEFLLQIYGAGMVTFRTRIPPFTPAISERPTASPVVRWQAARSESVTSLFHVTVKVEDEIGRQLLTWLDGSHDRNALAEMLLQFLASKCPSPPPAAPDPDLRGKVESDLAKNLAKLARFGLLIG